jgi:alkylhydroperoxidase/carboxymuconolactone decarboxylase family protein YurZ
VLHTAVYAGIPAATAALRVAERTLIEIGSLPEPTGGAPV